MALAGGVRWRDERVVAVLEHADDEAVCETFSGGVEVEEHCVAPPPTDDPDRVRVNACLDERHCPPPIGGSAR